MDSQELFAWESAIHRRARFSGLKLDDASVGRLAAHARAVMAANDLLHLTAIRDPEAFVDRHLGESFEGAAMLDASLSGVMLDLGSGNGYPGIPIAIARPGLVPYLADASQKKAAFLETVLRVMGFDAGGVLCRTVARGKDVEDLPSLHLLVTRAMGGWERIVPRVASRVAPEGSVLIWASDESAPIFRRVAWSKLELTASKSVPHRERSKIFQFKVNN